MGRINTLREGRRVKEMLSREELMKERMLYVWNEIKNYHPRSLLPGKSDRPPMDMVVRNILLMTGRGRLPEVMRRS